MPRGGENGAGKPRACRPETAASVITFPFPRWTALRPCHGLGRWERDESVLAPRETIGSLEKVSEWVERVRIPRECCPETTEA
jgi:hypothetical protein